MLSYQRLTNSESYDGCRRGTFTQEDPIGLAGGMNLYGFAGGDPVNFTDPFGLFPCCIEGTAMLDASRLMSPPTLRLGDPRTDAFVGLVLGVTDGGLSIERETAATLPGRVIAKEGEVEVVHNYRSGDHGPGHAHVNGGGTSTPIGPKGFPLKGDPPLSSAQQSVVDQYAAEIRKAINTIGRWLRSQEK
jgi:hypothetical protein